MNVLFKNLEKTSHWLIARDMAAVVLRKVPSQVIKHIKAKDNPNGGYGILKYITVKGVGYYGNEYIGSGKIVAELHHEWDEETDTAIFTLVYCHPSCAQIYNGVHLGKD